MAGQSRTSGVAWETKAFRRQLTKDVAAIRIQTIQELEGLAIDITNRAKQLSPVRTGFLRSTIGWRREGNTVIIFVRAFYARFIEFGTRFSSAQPFMRPAFAEALSRFAQKFRKRAR